MQDAYQRSLPFLSIHTGFQALITQAPSRSRNDLENTGWVRHTLESAVWALFTFPTFEEGLVNVVNLGNDADTAGAVYGAMAGAFFGLQSIPAQWRQTLHGNWPIGSTTVWTENEFIQMAIKLALR